MAHVETRASVRGAPEARPPAHAGREWRRHGVGRGMRRLAGTLALPHSHPWIFSASPRRGVRQNGASHFPKAFASLRKSPGRPGLFARSWSMRRRPPTAPTVSASRSRSGRVSASLCSPPWSWRGVFARRKQC